MDTSKVILYIPRIAKTEQLVLVLLNPALEYFHALCIMQHVVAQQGSAPETDCVAVL